MTFYNGTTTADDLVNLIADQLIATGAWMDADLALNGVDAVPGDALGAERVVAHATDPNFYVYLSRRVSWNGNTSNARFNEVRTAEGKLPVNLAVGVHYGPVLMGNIGSASRMEFAVIGDTVNIASRIEHLSRALAAPLVFSDALVARLKAENPDGLPGMAALADRGPQALKGRLDDMRLWTLG